MITHTNFSLDVNRNEATLMVSAAAAVLSPPSSLLIQLKTVSLPFSRSFSHFSLSSTQTSQAQSPLIRASQARVLGAQHPLPVLAQNRNEQASVGLRSCRFHCFARGAISRWIRAGAQYRRQGGNEQRVKTLGTSWTLKRKWWKKAKSRLSSRLGILKSFKS